MSLLRLRYYATNDELQERELEALRLDAEGRPYFRVPGVDLWVPDPHARTAKEHVEHTGFPEIVPVQEGELLSIAVVGPTGRPVGDCGSASRLGFTWHEGSPAPLGDLLYLITATGAPALVNHGRGGWQADANGEAYPFAEIRIARVGIELDPAPLGPRARLSPLAARTTAPRA